MADHHASDEGSEGEGERVGWNLGSVLRLKGSALTEKGTMLRLEAAMLVASSNFPPGNHQECHPPI